MNILITGANSYIGNNIACYLRKTSGHIIQTISVRNNEWMSKSFENIDVIIHCAALVHKNEKKHTLDEYRQINVTLTEELAKKAKNEGVKHFIFMSSRAVYGQENSCWHEVVVGKNTPLRPKSKYAITKLEAETKLISIKDDKFRVSIIRSPFVYGPGCRGNYQKLRLVSLKTPVLPDIKNEYSMLYIDNLCELIRQIVDKGLYGYFMPQDYPLHSTVDMMKLIKKNNGQKVISTKLFNPVIRILSTICRTVRNAFGNAIYDPEISNNIGLNYSLVDFEDSLIYTEKQYYSQESICISRCC